MQKNKKIHYIMYSSTKLQITLINSKLGMILKHVKKYLLY